MVLIMIKNKLLLLILTIGSLFALNIYSPYKIEFIGHYDKIWGHHTNNIKKLNAGLFYYKGVELDLVFLHNKYLIVNHPPEKSDNLQFEKYIKHITKKGNKRPFLWLDIKNLNIENAQIILKKITAIFKENNYPHEKILIESNRPETLFIFHKENFRTTYYLPNLSNIEKSLLDKEVKKIRQQLTYQELEISTDYINYNIIKKRFPNRTKNLWILSKKNIFRFFNIKKSLNDPKVKTILTRY